MTISRAVIVEFSCFLLLYSIEGKAQLSFLLSHTKPPTVSAYATSATFLWPGKTVRSYNLVVKYVQIVRIFRYLGKTYQNYTPKLFRTDYILGMLVTI